MERPIFYTIYKITNKTDGKYYIGKHQTDNIDDGYFGSGKLIKRAVTKHGKDQFIKEILFVFDNEADMNSKEAELVVVSEDTYNLCDGGKGGFSYINTQPRTWIGRKHSESTRNKMKIARQKRVYTDEDRKKISEGCKDRPSNFLGKNHTEDTLRQMSEKRRGTGIGERNSQSGSRWITDGQLNKKLPKNDPLPKGWNYGRFYHPMPV